MKDILTSPRMEDMKRKRKRRRVRLFILFSILFLIIFGTLAYFSSNSKVTINNIKVSGTRIINASDVQWSVKDSIAGKYLYLFSRSNIVIYPHDKIYNKLLSDFPRIEKLSVDREGLNTLSIKITERFGSYLYCGDKIPDDSSLIGENCYFINNDGYIFDKAPYFSGNVYFKYYGELSGEGDSPLGKHLFTLERFHEIARFIDGVTALGFEPSYLVLNKDGNVLYLNHRDSDTAPQILFKDENNLEEILGNLTLSMAKQEFASEVRSKYTTLLYIDLRFDNKVLYKFANE